MTAAADMVSAIDTAILALVTNRIAAYNVSGVSYTYADLGKLRELRRYYAALAARSAGRAVRVADVRGAGS